MHQHHQHLCVNLIHNEWRDLSPESRPWGVWIRAYPAIIEAQPQIDIAVWPEAVWFVTAAGVTRQSIDMWRRFQVMQIDRAWCKRGFVSEPVAVFGKRHEIGLAAFAYYEGRNAMYLETIWGGLFGHGWKLSFASDTIIEQRQLLWVA